MDPELIHDYDPAWQDAYATEHKRVHAQVGPLIEAIEHIGSTSVPRLAAKPLIDMMLAVRPGRLEQCIDPLRRLGYQRDQTGDFRWRIFLRRLDAQGQPTHHLSLTELGSPYWQDQLAFRDALRADPALATDYAELKRTLAAKHGRDVAYTQAKTDFIRRALAAVGHQPRSGWASEPSSRSAPVRSGSH
jgi:GrpB-like predicted nucleotidyltransferase (UPF0157 family)